MSLKKYKTKSQLSFRSIIIRMARNNYLVEGERIAIEYIGELIGQGESLLDVKEHPGRTTEFIEWKQKVDTFVIRRYGKSSFQWGQIARTTIIPDWFKPEIHGKIEGYGIVLTDAQDNDRKTAMNLYKEGINKLIAILKGLKDDIEVNGLPPEPDQKTSSSSPIYATNISPQFTQTQSQSQEQQLNLEFSVKEVRRIVEETVGNKEDIKQANEVLDELEKEAKEDKPKWSTVKRATEMFLRFGRDAFISLLPVLLQVYGAIPPTPMRANQS